MDESTQINKSNVKENIVEKFEEEENPVEGNPEVNQQIFDKYLKASNRLSDMQQHLISHIGLSMGMVSTIIFISNTKTFISSYLKYIIFSLMVYSFILAITGVGEYIEKYVQFMKYKEFKDVTTWDFILSIMYFIVGIVMLVIIILLYVSLTKEKLV
tara:strand:- start:154 stop:624 length:471 start_codon:yes stop_codon:yes gene_type:complete